MEGQLGTPPTPLDAGSAPPSFALILRRYLWDECLGFRGNTPERAGRPDRQKALGGNAGYRNATSLSPLLDGPKCIVPDKVNGIVPKDVLNQVCP